MQWVLFLHVFLQYAYPKIEYYFLSRLTMGDFLYSLLKAGYGEYRGTN